MINTANENLERSGRNNIAFRVMNNLDMDVPKKYFDVVVARNTVTDPKQIYEVLKPGGYLIIRGVDKLDCWGLKRIFNKGQGYYDEKPISLIDYENVLDAGFKDVELVPIHCREYFTDYEKFYNFLLKVPMGFIILIIKIKKIDSEKLKEYVSENTYQKKIRLIRRYYGITARKR